MFKSIFNYWKGVLDKIIPAQYQGYIFLLSLIIIALALTLNNNEKDKNNQDFYKLELKSRISEIIEKEDGFHYRIDSNWYLIKHIIVKHISIGDSILKDSNSLDIIIKGPKRIKWNSAVNRDIIFKLITPENKKADKD